MTVYLIRHGESMANRYADLPLREGYNHIIDDDVPLTAWGYRQALDAGHFLKQQLGTPEGPVKLFRSPYLRTCQTVDGLREVMGEWAFDIHDSAYLCEQDFGLFNCITDDGLLAELWPEYQEDFQRERQADKHHASAPRGESRADVVERIRRFVELHREDFENPRKQVVIIGHGLSNRVLEMCLRGLDEHWLLEQNNPGNCDIRRLDGDLRNGFVAEYVHHGAQRPQHLPEDYADRPHPAGKDGWER